MEEIRSANPDPETPAEETAAEPAPETAEEVPAEPAPETAEEVPAEPAPETAEKAAAEPAPEPAEKKDWLRYLIVFFVYVAAGAIALIFHHVLSLPFWLDILIADIVATVVVFCFSTVFTNSSVYDPYWSVQPIVIVVMYAIAEQKLTLTMILPLVAVLVWGVRLTANWAYSFRGIEAKYEDWRYQELREKTGKWFLLVNFFGIHLVPTLIVYACVLPVVYTFEYAPAFSAWSAVFFALSILAILLECVADCTLHKFKKEGGTGFLRKGLWKYCRHPNYLGEILMWWGIALAAVCVMPRFAWLIVGAVANTVLFLAVSIPMADRHQSRKEGFELYKKNTWSLCPLPKRQHKEEPAPEEPVS